MSKLNELQSAFKIIKKDYKSCKKDVSKLHQAIIRFNNDIEDLKGEILKAEKYLILESSEEKIFQLIVYRPKVRIKKKKQTIIQQSDFVDYQPFENDILVRDVNQCIKFVDLAKKELKIWEDARSQFREEYELALTDLKEKSSQYFSVQQKIVNRIELVISKSNLKKNKKELSEYKKLYKVYLDCCIKYQAEKPSVRRLESLTKGYCSRSKWNRLFREFDFCDGIKRELIKKLHYYKKNKTKQEFWEKKLQDFNDYEYAKACEVFANKHKELKQDLEDVDVNEDGF